MKKSRSYNEVRGKSSKKSKYHTEGNLDSNILFQIAKHLKKKYHMPWNQIKIENAIKFTDNYYEIVGKKEYIEISNIAKSFLVHTPDIIITDKHEVPKLIIEQDGKKHDDEKNMMKDRRRNKHYAKAGIPLIIINFKKLRKIKKTYQTYLDEEIEKMNIEFDVDSMSR